MQAAEQDVLHADRQLPLDRVANLGPYLGAARDDRLTEPAIAVDEIEHRGRLAAVIRDQVARGRLGRRARPRRFDEHLELSRLTSWQWLPIGGRARREWAAVELVQARGDAIDDILRHHAVRRQLPTGDRDQAMRAFEHPMLTRHL